MKSVLAFLIILLSIFFVSCDPESPLDEVQYADNVVIVSGDISSDTTWYEGKVYFIDGLTRLNPGNTLTIQPGAVVKFSGLGSLCIENGAKVSAEGTALKPLIFTSVNDLSAGGDTVLNDVNQQPLAGAWYGVDIEAGSSGSRFVNCHFLYGGLSGYAVLRINGEARVENCTFRDNLGGHPYDGSAIDTAALDASLALESTVVTGNIFYRNTWPLAISCSMNLDDTNRFEFDEDGDSSTADEVNKYQAIYINYGDISGFVSWEETEVPLCFFDLLLRVTSTGTLDLASGVVIKSSSAEFQYEYGATVNSTGVIFTSFRDDALLGDTNCDGTVSIPADGDWKGVCELDDEGNVYWMTRNNGGSVRYSLEG